MPAPTRWRNRFLICAWTLFALPVLLLWSLLCAAFFLGLYVGVPLGAAGLWVIYALPALLAWSISPVHHPLLYLGVYLVGAIPSGAVVFGCVQALLAVAAGGGRESCATRAAPPVTRTIRRRAMVLLRQEDIPYAWQAHHADHNPVLLLEEQITEYDPPSSTSHEV